METESLEFKSSLGKVNSSIDTSIRIFDLPILIEKMKHEQIWTEGELNAKILLKSPNRQIVLTALHDGTEINSFQSNDSVTFQIIEGIVKFRSRKVSMTLEKGQLFSLYENVNYVITAKEDTVLLLTIVNRILQPVEN